jgi:uncharacterized lipoprotein YddW (UPF0748 family)
LGIPFNPLQRFQGIALEEETIKRHLRGTWISTVVNLDWPLPKTADIKEDSLRIEKSKEELLILLDKAVEMNLNAIFFQVSPSADALYQSKIVPWSRYLTGTFGKDPGFDPLDFIIQEAHKRNLELHAWFNPYRVSLNTSETTKNSLQIPKSVYQENPSWIRTANNRFVVDPGIPEVMDWAIARVMEVVENYDVDGVHFDDYFYYESFFGDLEDQATYRKYNNGQFSKIEDWRRNNTYTLVKELSKKIRSQKPWVKFGISPSGVWSNQSENQPTGSKTQAGFTNYDNCFADTKKWVEEEWIDYIAPQIYFSFKNSRAPYGELVNWWGEVVRGRNVHLYIGNALYKVNDDHDSSFQGNQAVSEIQNQLHLNTMHQNVYGSIFFRTMNFFDINKQIVVENIKNQAWNTKALVPVMPWKGGKIPERPRQGSIEQDAQGVRVSWKDEDVSTTYYVIYRFEKNEKIEIQTHKSAKNIIHIQRKEDSVDQTFIDLGRNVNEDMSYVITAMDRLHNESSELILSKSASQYFPDISQNHAWAGFAIDALFEKGVIKGDHKGLFHPGNPSNRADFIIMLLGTLDLSVKFDDNFIDVEEGKYYYNHVGMARKLGIIKGDGTRFYPENPITREDMMVMIWNTMEMLKISKEPVRNARWSDYKDSRNINFYARNAISKLSEAGVIQGYDGYIHPQNLATRAECVVMLNSL